METKPKAVKAIFISFAVIAFIATLFLQSAYSSNRHESGLNECEGLAYVQSINVNPDSIILTFDGSPVIGRRDFLGRVEPIEYGSLFTIKKGDNIHWGDGDHFMTELTVKTIKENTATLQIKEEFRFPGRSGRDEETVADCRIVKKYPHAVPKNSRNCATACKNIIPEQSMPKISAKELENGMYYGRLSQKKTGTPDDWIHVKGENKSAAWLSPKTAKNQNCDCNQE